MATTQGVTGTTLRTIDPVSSSEWTELINNTASTVFHSPEWLRVVQQTYGISHSACILERDGEIAAGIPWAEIDDFAGSRRMSLAFSDFCDPIGQSAADRAALAEAVMRDGLPWTLRAFSRNVPALSCRAEEGTTFKWHGLDVTADEEVLWGRLNSMSQRGVRKAEKSGVQAVIATSKGDLREWYMLHLRLRRSKHNMLAQPYKFFENIWDTFIADGKHGFLLNAVVDGRVVGGTLYIAWQDVCYYKFNASDPDSLGLRPNNLLMWRGMLEAKERGFRLVDLGRSNAKQEGLISYKRGFGPEEDEVRTITYLPDGYAPDHHNEARALLRELTRIFVNPDVPEGVAEEAGTLLYRYFV